MSEVIEIAFKNYQAGNISRDALVAFLEGMINVAALENGYAEKFGLPFPERLSQSARRVLRLKGIR